MKGKCLCCGNSTPVDRMHDALVCKYCFEDADREAIKENFRKSNTRFSRRIPTPVRDFVFHRDNNICQYCLLNEATELDHVLPYSFLPDHSSDNLVASCSRCNRLAGNKMFPCLEDKRRYLIQRLSGRRKRIPIWTLRELEGLDYSLKNMKRIVVATEKERLEMVEYVKFFGLEPITTTIP